MLFLPLATAFPATLKSPLGWQLRTVGMIMSCNLALERRIRR
jgi:hypothetical protein